MALFIGLVTTGFVVRPESWLIRIPLIALTATVSFCCAVITHNTVHAPIFHGRLANKIVQVVLTVCYGHPVSMYVPGHNLSHHQHLQTPRDLMRTSKLRFRWNLLNQLWFFYAVSGPITRDNFKYASFMRTRKPAWFRQMLLESFVFIGGLGSLLFLDWQSFIFYVLIPHHAAAWGIVGINFVQHDGCDADHPVNHSRNFTGAVTNFFFFNNGYHGIHHIKPSLHWSKTPEAHREQLSPTIHPALEQRSLIGYCFGAYIWPGTRLTYDGKPLTYAEPEPADEPWFDTRAELPGEGLGAET